MLQQYLLELEEKLAGRLFGFAAGAAQSEREKTRPPLPTSE